jgi:hypothetical protein
MKAIQLKEQNDINQYNSINIQKKSSPEHDLSFHETQDKTGSNPNATKDEDPKLLESKCQTESMPKMIEMDESYFEREINKTRQNKILIGEKDMGKIVLSVVNEMDHIVMKIENDDSKPESNFANINSPAHFSSVNRQNLLSKHYSSIRQSLDVESHREV